MKGQTNNRCIWEGIPGKEKAYCHLFNAKCEICPFNQGSGAIIGMDGNSHVLPEKYLLSREHLWVAPSADERLLVGLDSFLAHSLFHVRGIVQPALRSHISVGKSCVWVIDLLGTISLRAPISGTVIACNHKLVIHPSWAKENPYGGGWLFEVEPEGNWRSELMNAENGQVFISRSQNMLKDKMVNAPTGGADSPRLTDQRAVDGGILYFEKIMESNPKAYLQNLLETLEESRWLSK
jgi:glycine cleavage system H protein